jgi:hypothetical protein
MIATPLLIEMPSDSRFPLRSQMPFTDLKIIEVEKVFYRRMISAFYLSDRREPEKGWKMMENFRAVARRRGREK